MSKGMRYKKLRKEAKPLAAPVPYKFQGVKNRTIKVIAPVEEGSEDEKKGFRYKIEKAIGTIICTPKSERGIYKQLKLRMKKGE